MAKQKKSILILSFLAAFCATLGVSSLASEPVLAEDATTEVTADVTVSQDFLAKGVGVTSSEYVYEYSHLATDTNNTTYGLVPYVAWAAEAATDDGYITYLFEAGSMQVLSDLTFSFTVGVGHQGGLFWYQKKGDTLGANARVEYSYDNSTWTEVYDLAKAEGNPISKAQEVWDNKYTPSIDLSEYAKGQTAIYVKLCIDHFTVEEINANYNAEGNLGKTKVALGDCGAMLFGVNATANFENMTSDIYYTDDYKNGFSTNTVSPYTSGTADIYDHDGVYTESGYGILPFGLNENGEYARGGDGYVTYRIGAEHGKVLGETFFDFSLGIGHCSGVYYWNTVGGVKGANAYVYVSDNNATWTEILDFNKAYPEAIKVQDPYSNYTDVSLDLTDYAEGKEEIFVKIFLDHRTLQEAIDGTTAGNDSWTEIPVTQTGLMLKSVTVNAMQTTAQEEVGTYYYKKDFQQTTAKDGVFVESSNVTSAGKYGQAAWGMIPATTWGEPAKGVGNGTMTYKLPLNGNGTFTNFESLSAKLSYVLHDKHNANLIVEYGYDNAAWTTAYNAREQKAFGRNLTKIDLATALVSDQALTAEYLYVRVTMAHDSGDFNLNALGVYTHSVEFEGTQSLVMEKGASVRLDGNNGIRFTTLVDTDVVAALEEKYAEVSYGTFIMPKDYIEAYGELTLANLFGENAKYCWGGKVEGKTQILHRKSLLTENYVDGYHAFKYSIVNILDSNLTRQFVGLGYIACVDSEGKTTYILASYAGGDVEKTARSVAYVAQKEVETNGEGAEICQSEYLNKLTSEDKATYTVIHVVISKAGNINEYSVDNTQSAAIGSTVTVTPSNSFNGYTMVNEARIGAINYKTQLSGTVDADGRLVLYVYYGPVA